MSLPIYDTQDAVPEDQREDYVEHEGKWRPKVEVDLAVEKRKRQQLLDEKKAEEKARKEAEQKLADAQRAADAKEKGISEAELQKIRDAEAAARKPIEEERDRYKELYEKATLTDRVQAIALTAGVMPDRIKPAMKLLKDRTRLGDAGGIVVLDEDGKDTAETIEDFLGKTFKKESPWLYAGSGASGSGASGSSGGSGGTQQVDTATQAKALEAKRPEVMGAF